MDTKPKEFWEQEIEKATGEEVMMNTPACVVYKTDNNNCRGCSYELNCAKLSNLMMLQCHMSLYKPVDFLDSVKAGQQSSALISDIINAKSVEEIEKIVKGEKNV
jgi:hypothetical protein